VNLIGRFEFVDLIRKGSIAKKNQESKKKMRFELVDLIRLNICWPEKLKED